MLARGVLDDGSNRKSNPPNLVRTAADKAALANVLDTLNPPPTPPPLQHGHAWVTRASDTGRGEHALQWHDGA